MSKDSIKSHNKFIEKLGIPFILLSDESLTMLEEYGVMKEKQMFGKTTRGIHRSTFVIDEDGIIEKIYDKVDTETHAEEILKDLGAR